MRRVGAPVAADDQRRDFPLPRGKAAKRALIQETTIRQVMAETGEDRKTVTDMMAAMGSMGQEAVLDLTEGEPTTLAEALQRYVDTLEQAAMAEETIRAEHVCDALSALLAYPWPDGRAPANAALGIRHADDETVIVTVGGVEIITANHDEHGWAGMELAQKTAEGVHRALLAVFQAPGRAARG